MNKNRKPYTLLNIFITVIILGVVIVSTQINKTNIANKKAHASTECAGPLSIQVSVDKINPSASVTLPIGVSSRYYVHVSSASKPCSTAFDVLTCSEVLGQNTCQNQSNWKVVSPWGTNRSNTLGIARIDWDKWSNTNANRIFHMKLRRYDSINHVSSSDAWSNEVTQVVNGTAPAKTIDTLPYWISTPGYVWEYLNENDITKSHGTKTRIQIEQPSIVCNNPQLVSTPWRITKNNPDAYWDPNFNWRPMTWNERWLMAAPDFTSSQYPNFNNYTYMLGDKRYDFNASPLINDYRDINLKAAPGGYYFQTKGLHSPLVPGYNYFPKKLADNFTYLDTFEGESLYTWTNGDFNSTGCTMVNPVSSGKYSSWKTRIEKDTISIDNPNFKYTGEALRMDNYEGEGGAPLGIYPNLLRESWYFVKNIGLVKVVVAHFNNYAGKGADYCISSNDCWDDTIQNPTLVMTLDRYFQNPTLQVQISANGTTWSDSVATTKSQGYYLKTTPAYTGYLEAKNFQGKIHKWLWVENGIVQDKANLVTFPLQTPTSASFRIWIPNEPIFGETRTGNNTLPWSNTITFTLIN